MADIRYSFPPNKPPMLMHVAPQSVLVMGIPALQGVNSFVLIHSIEPALPAPKQLFRLSNTHTPTQFPSLHPRFQKLYLMTEHRSNINTGKF